MTIDTQLKELMIEVLEPLMKELNEIKQKIIHNNLPPVLSVEEAAKLARRGKAFIYDAIRTPDFPAIKGDGGKYIIITELYLEWLKKKASSQ